MSGLSPTISVVMSVYNGDEYITDAIESILNQTYTNFEFILIDDGSTDNSLEIIQRYANEDCRIQAIVNESNVGLARSLNIGIALARGKYIARMDSDDISLPDRFETQVAFLDSHPDIDVVGGQIVKFGESAQAGRKSNYPLTPGGVRWGLVFGCQLAHSTVMMRSQLFSVEGFRYRELRVAQDYDLWTRVSPAHNIANLSDVLVQYRVHKSSISEKNRQNQTYETIRIIKDYVRELSSVDLPEDIIKGLIVSKNTRSVEDALFLSRVLLKLEKLTKGWGLSGQEKADISHQAAYKLHSICKHFKYNPRLYPALLASGFLESKSWWFSRFKDRTLGD